LILPSRFKKPCAWVEETNKQPKHNNKIVFFISIFSRFYKYKAEGS